jgi:hypothetical protein
MPLDGAFAVTGTGLASPVSSVPRAQRSWTSNDLNYLFRRQQIERSRASSAASASARAVHAQLAHLYEDAIEQVTGGNIRFRHAPPTPRAIVDRSAAELFIARTSSRVRASDSD